jgi:hypothetical protein
VFFSDYGQTELALAKTRSDVESACADASVMVDTIEYSNGNYVYNQTEVRKLLDAVITKYPQIEEAAYELSDDKKHERYKKESAGYISETPVYQNEAGSHYLIFLVKIKGKYYRLYDEEQQYGVGSAYKVEEY